MCSKTWIVFKNAFSHKMQQRCVLNSLGEEELKHRSFLFYLTMSEESQENSQTRQLISNRKIRTVYPLMC
jgi:hypothetical protein